MAEKRGAEQPVSKSELSIRACFRNPLKISQFIFQITDFIFDTYHVADCLSGGKSSSSDWEE
jgi:hypothetical protein